MGWFNKVDASYRSELRELFDVHFARFDAKVQQRIAEVKGELRAELHDKVSELRGDMQRMEVRLIRWMFLFWVGTIGTMAALLGNWG